MEVAELPAWTFMVYPVVEPSMADDTVLEGRGVIPDISVTTTRAKQLNQQTHPGAFGSPSEQSRSDAAR